MRAYGMEDAQVALRVWPAAVGTIPNGLMRYLITGGYDGAFRFVDARVDEPYLLPIFRDPTYKVQVFATSSWFPWKEGNTVCRQFAEMGERNVCNILSDAAKAALVRLPLQAPFPTVQCPRCPDGPGTGTAMPFACGQCGGSAKILQTSWPVELTEEEALDAELLFDLANAPEHKTTRDLAAALELPQELLGGDYTPAVAEKVEQALCAGRTSTGVDLPLTPEINTAITEALKPRQATVSNLVAAVVTIDEIREEFDAKFCSQVLKGGGYLDSTVNEASEHFRGRRVTTVNSLAMYPAGTLFFIEGLDRTGFDGVFSLRLSRLVGGVEYRTLLMPNPPMPLSTFLGCVNAIHHPDDVEVVRGTDVRIPYSIKLSDERIIPAGSIATCRYINIAVDKEAQTTTITFEAPFGYFAHHTLRPERHNALPGHQRKTRTVTTTFTKSQTRSIIKDYVGGAGLYAIGVDFGVSAATVKRVLVQNDVTIRSQGRPINAAAAYQAGTGLGKLSEQTGIPVKRLRANIAAKGVKIRGVGRPKKSI